MDEEVENKCNDEVAGRQQEDPEVVTEGFLPQLQTIGAVEVAVAEADHIVRVVE